MVYFNEQEAANRYALYRPKIHAEIIKKAKPCFGPLPLNSALDVACGTGDSTLALSNIAKQVMGVDSSPAMLAHAANHAVEVQQLSAEQLPLLGQQFDLISTCMAFHWFDQQKAIPAYKAASKPGCYWLIYNIAFKGQSNSAGFDQALSTYLCDFPTPIRGSTSPMGRLKKDESIELVCHLEGNVETQFDLPNLVGYLTTQSNVENAIQSESSYSEVESILTRIFKAVDCDKPFLFHYDVDVFRYTPVD